MNVSTEGLINISDASNPDNVYDTSDDTFEIRAGLNVTDPSTSGIVMTYNGTSTYDINWSTYGTITNVNITYSTNGGSSYPNIINDSFPADNNP